MKRFVSLLALCWCACSSDPSGHWEGDYTLDGVVFCDLKSAGAVTMDLQKQGSQLTGTGTFGDLVVPMGSADCRVSPGPNLFMVSGNADPPGDLSFTSAGASRWSLSLSANWSGNSLTGKLFNIEASGQLSMTRKGSTSGTGGNGGSGGQTGGGGGSGVGGGNTTGGSGGGTGGSGGGSCPIATCNGLCVDTRTDPQHCSSCGVVCEAVANGTDPCVAGRCTIQCAPGYADCNGTRGDGCEAVLATRCPNQQHVIGLSCAANQCYYTGCQPNFVDCNGQMFDGCEFDLLAQCAGFNASGLGCV